MDLQQRTTLLPPSWLTVAGMLLGLVLAVVLPGTRAPARTPAARVGRAPVPPRVGGELRPSAGGPVPARRPERQTA